MSLFTLFGLEKQKKRKRKLVDMLWCDHRHADASAEVVLSVFRDHMEARHAWVENKRDARVRADLLCTVQVSDGIFCFFPLFVFWLSLVGVGCRLLVTMVWCHCRVDRFRFVISIPCLLLRG